MVLYDKRLLILALLSLSVLLPVIQANQVHEGKQGGCTGKDTIECKGYKMMNNLKKHSDKVISAFTAARNLASDFSNENWQIFKDQLYYLLPRKFRAGPDIFIEFVIYTISKSYQLVPKEKIDGMLQLAHELYFAKMNIIQKIIQYKGFNPFLDKDQNNCIRTLINELIMPPNYQYKTDTSACKSYKDTINSLLIPLANPPTTFKGLYKYGLVVTPVLLLVLIVVGVGLVWKEFKVFKDLKAQEPKVIELEPSDGEVSGGSYQTEEFFMA
ncbi:unnamed protein product [Moneuplotes crassus]|uniref:Uncharacterized protein n=1 Tax=Euplotes crassus TaxID=5936 RepID=A0AAD1XNQ8_EUPCR|nr:unnamed protein product [Moneuplotes crassus]